MSQGPPRDPTACVIVIGDEILSGKVDDSNLRFLIAQLWELGVRLKAAHVIPDDPETIACTVRAVRGSFDYVFTTGGVGPTHDDVTVPAIARGLDRKLVRHPELMAAIERLSGGPVSDVIARMADIPEGTTLLWGERLRFPVLALENIYILPGEPSIMQRKFLAIRERFRSTPFHLTKIFTTCEEGEIARVMEEAQERHAGVAVGSYPVYDHADYKVQITVQSRDAATVKSAVEHILKGIPNERVVRVV